MASTAHVLDEHRLVGVGSPAMASDRFASIRETHGTVVKVTEPDRTYWMVLDYELARECLQDPATFSSEVITPLNPEPPFKMIPIQLDPPDHAPYRRLLAAYFSPRQMAELGPAIDDRALRLVEQIKSRGECDYIEDFALKLPTAVFLEMLGLPLEQLDQFLDWEAQILSPGEDGQFDAEGQLMAMLGVAGYFQEELTRRRSESVDSGDLLSQMLAWEIEGEPVSDENLINCCILLFLAGLDTVAMSLSFAMHHLATHPDDRRRVAEAVAAGEPVDEFVEELLRYFAVPEVGRKVTKDVVISGHEFKAGELVLFPLVAANRDDKLVASADAIDLGRDRPAAHIAFGAGAHRCLGSHLARIEMAVALRVWHAAIPDYSLAAGTSPKAYWGNVHGMYSLQALRVCGRSGVKIVVDRALCAGHARCHAMAEDLFPLDDLGYFGADIVEVPATEESRARIGVESCPEGALRLE